MRTREEIQKSVAPPDDRAVLTATDAEITIIELLLDIRDLLNSAYGSNQPEPSLKTSGASMALPGTGAVMEKEEAIEED